MYLAVHKETGVPCAVKTINKNWIKRKDKNREKHLELLSREIKSLEDLMQAPQETHITKVIDLYHESDFHYFVMELITGGTLL